MFHRSCFALALLAVSVGHTTAHASGIPYHPGPYSPITYDFGGTLSQPIDGSSSFSGTFTFDNGLPPNTGLVGNTPGNIPRSSIGDPTATLSVGGQAFVFTQPGLIPGGDPGIWVYASPNPQILFTLLAQSAQGDPSRLFPSAGLPYPTDGSQGFLLTTSQAGDSPNGVTALMTINLLNTAGNIWAMNPNATSLPLLKLPDFNINQFALNVTLANGTQETATGYLTKLEPEVATPEPSTIAIFSYLAACSLFYRHARRPSGARACEKRFPAACLGRGRDFWKLPLMIQSKSA